MTSESIIDNFAEHSAPRLASKWSRLANHIIDYIAFMILIALHAFILGGILDVIPEEGSPFLGIYFILFYFLYLALFEHFFAKTPGKFLTKTHVVTKDGQRPGFLNILGRNLCRLIPFDNFSFLISERGWHDELSKTSVVYDR